MRVTLALILLLTAAQSVALAQAPSPLPGPGPSTPPGLPSPARAAIPSLPSTAPKTPIALSATSKSPSIAPPAYEPPVSEVGPNDLELQNADNAAFDSNNNMTVTGNVRLRYRTYTLFADKAVINTDTGIGSLSGHVRMVSDNGKVTVNSLTADSELKLNMKSGVYDIIGGSAVIAPDQLPSVTGLALPIRLYGGDIKDTPRFIDARETSATTCDFPNPHYFFRAKDTVIIPGRRLVARDVTLYRRNHRIITIPYLLFPLDNRYMRQGLTPQVGEDSEEGYFAKFALPYALTATAIGILRLDAMSKLGLGTGITQSFSNGGGGSKTIPGTSASSLANVPTTEPGSSPILTNGLLGGTIQNGGTVQVYHIANNRTGLDETTGSFTDNQTLFHNIKLGIDTQFQNDDYLSSAGQSNALSSQFTLSRAVKGASSTFSTDVQQSNYGLGTSNTITSSFEQNNALSKITNLDMKFDFSQFDSPGYDGISGSSQNTFATNFNLTSHPKGYQIQMLTNTFSATSSTGAPISGGVERLPEINIQSVPSVTDHLFPRLLPALTKYTLDFGDFVESVDNAQDLRAQFGLDTGNNTIKHDALTNTYSSSFLQSFYSDNTAQYVLQDQFGSTYNFQKQSSFGATYSYLRPYGYTPFLFDETGNYNNINVNFNYEPNKRLLVTLSSGFDIGEDHAMYGLPAMPWLDVNGQVDYRIDKRLLNVLTSSYDPNTGMLFNVADTTRITLPWGLAFNSALNYVPQTGEFSNINADLDLPWVTDPSEQAGYELRALAGYDGITDQFTYDGFELTRTWHDWELSAIYQNNTQSATPGSSFYLNFRLKAFPGFEPFGVGQFGQGLDTGIGQVY